MGNINNWDEIALYIKEHPAVVLGTIDTEGRPHGAAVFMYASAEVCYFVTKTETQKYKNILAHPAVSVTIVDASDNSSLQIRGRAHVVKDAQIIEMVMENMAKIYAKSADWLPPLAKLRAGQYEVVRIDIGDARLAAFKGKHAGSPDIFKEG